MEEQDVLGVRMPVFVRRQTSLWDLLVSAAERFPDRPYVIFPDARFTFREILGPVAAAARVLRDSYGVGKGDRVAIASANCVEYVIAFWATTALGGVTVALNGWWTAPELSYGIQLTDPKVVLADARRLERIEQTPDDLGMPVVALESDWWRAGESGGGAGSAAAQTVAADVPVNVVDEDDPYLILFTSGTTGRPKGALLSHRGNIHFIQSSLLSGALSALAAPERSADAVPPCVLSASPMFHIAGMNSQIVMAPVTGMTIVYPPPGRWQEAVHLAAVPGPRRLQLVAGPRAAVAAGRLPAARRLRPALAAQHRRRQLHLAARVAAAGARGAARRQGRDPARVRHDRDQRPGHLAAAAVHVHPSRERRAAQRRRRGRGPRPGHR